MVEGKGRLCWAPRGAVDGGQYTRPVPHGNPPYDVFMRRAARVTGILMVLAGGIWVLQGLDVAFAPQSFMTNDRLWVWLGGAVVVGGVALVWWGRRAG